MYYVKEKGGVIYEWELVKCDFLVNCVYKANRQCMPPQKKNILELINKI